MPRVGFFEHHVVDGIGLVCAVVAVREWDERARRCTCGGVLRVSSWQEMDNHSCLCEHVGERFELRRHEYFPQQRFFCLFRQRHIQRQCALSTVDCRHVARVPLMTERVETVDVNVRLSKDIDTVRYAHGDGRQRLDRVRITRHIDVRTTQSFQ